MQASRVYVAPQIAEIDWEHAECLRTIHHGRDTAFARK
jgi:hypothetical protein